jgi:hypothetical protein
LVVSSAWQARQVSSLEEGAACAAGIDRPGTAAQVETTRRTLAFFNIVNSFLSL